MTSVDSYSCIPHLVDVYKIVTYYWFLGDIFHLSLIHLFVFQISVILC